MSAEYDLDLSNEVATNSTNFDTRDYLEIIERSLASVLLIFTTILAILFLVFCICYRRKLKKQERLAQTGTNISLVSLNTVSRQAEYQEQSYQYARYKNSIKAGKMTTMPQSSHGPYQQEQLYYNLEQLYNGSNTEPFYYMIPEANEEALYDQLEMFQISYLKLENILLGKKIGSGQFGEVHRGTWVSPEGKVEVALKTLKKGATCQEKVKFLQEVAIMAQFKHPCVVTMHGVIAKEEPMMLVLELLEGGDLRQHLQTSWNNCGDEAVKRHTFLSYCRQVVYGMAYLANKQFVHRDLAARNILVSGQNMCKIGDFGMSRDLMEEEYYVSKGGLIPVRWTAPEAIYYKKYSTASDMWSYGILLFEIWSVGRKPYERLNNNQVLGAIKSGYRLPPPPGCPRAIYSMMIDCCQRVKIKPESEVSSHIILTRGVHPEPCSRPSFEDITQNLSQSDLVLLQWTIQDKKTHSKADTLGAKLTVAKELYPDLQSTYQNTTFTP